ncbi:O-antigen ligase family protein [Candidatus Daviesbacteria bacterium]|nr:O-antigen ligase family protein [Candidatus Daviesbacteria bacterium]
MPIWVLPVGTSPFETPKVILAEVLIEVLLFLTLIKTKFSLKSFLNPAGLGLGILLILTIIHLLFFRTETTFFGNSFRLQGVFLLWHLAAFWWLSKNIDLPSKVYRFSLFTLTILTMSAYILGGDINGRAFGTLGEANSLAAAAIFFLPFGLINTPRWTKFVSLFLAGLIILASGSRAGVSALLIQLIFLGLLFGIRLNLTKTLITSLVLGLTTFILPIWAGGGWYENRAEIWQTSLFAGSFSPIFGQGFGNSQQAIHQASLILNNNVQYQFVDSAHNIFLDFWVQGGLLGVSSLAIIIIFSIEKLLVRKQVRELLILLGLLVTLSFNPLSVAILVFFWWTLGQGLKS